MKLPKLKYGDNQTVTKRIAYNDVMNLIDKRKLDCWNINAPDDFENHEPCEDSKDW